MIGEVLIYSDTIVGLVSSIVSKFSSIKNVNTKVIFNDGQIVLTLRGEAIQSITRTIKGLQQEVKKMEEALVQLLKMLE